MLPVGADKARGERLPVPETCYRCRSAVVWLSCSSSIEIASQIDRCFVIYLR